MARRRKEEGESVELFPFLSILACLIGILILLISVLSLGLMASPDMDAIQRAHEHKQLQEEIGRHEAREAELRRLIAQANALRQELEAARKLFDELRQRNQDQPDPEQLEQLSREKAAEATRLQRLIDQLEKQLKELLAEIEKLKEELAKRQEPVTESIVQVRPSSEQHGLRVGAGGIEPIFVECTATGLVINPGSEQPIPIPRRGITSVGDNADPSPQWIELLRSVGHDPNKMIIFLLRENGFAIWNLAKQEALLELHGEVKFSELPLIGDGKIDTSLFLPGN